MLKFVQNPKLTNTENNLNYTANAEMNYTIFQLKTPEIKNTQLSNSCNCDVSMMK